MGNKKVQVPVLGGLRKKITLGSDQPVGTTITEFGSQSVSLAQLKAALGIGTTTSGGTSGGGGGSAPAALVLGPGLTGGGSLVGAVPLRLTAPIPVNLDDSVSDDAISIPGPRGAPGVAGPPGPALFMLAEEPCDDVVFMIVKV